MLANSITCVIEEGKPLTKYLDFSGDIEHQPKVQPKYWLVVYQQGKPLTNLPH